MSISERTQQALEALNRFSQGDRGGQSASNIINLIGFLVENGILLKSELIEDRCSICRTTLTQGGRKLFCGHLVHPQCIILEDFRKGVSNIGRHCATCGQQVYVEGLPERETCCICKTNVPQQMLTMIRCGQTMHFYCKRDFEGMIEASLEVKSANIGQILCQEEGCQAVIGRETILGNVSQALIDRLKRYWSDASRGQ